uniref:Uncharacterized protein n=1 Tax=Arundo donax TaxID=35708 RepID=A0A0A8ZW85_ARUDO
MVSCSIYLRSQYVHINVFCMPKYGLRFLKILSLAIQWFLYF